MVHSVPYLFWHKFLVVIYTVNLFLCISWLLLCSKPPENVVAYKHHHVDDSRDWLFGLGLAGKAFLCSTWTFELGSNTPLWSADSPIASLTHLILGWLLTRVMAVIRPDGAHYPIGSPGRVHTVETAEFSKAAREGKAQYANTFACLCLCHGTHTIGQSKSHSQGWIQERFFTSWEKSHSENHADRGGRNLGLLLQTT